MRGSPDGPSDLRLDDLRWAARAADAGSLSVAARREHVAQSTVSRAIARLEAMLNVRLFERSGQVFQVTEAGEALLRRSREILEQVEALARAAAEADASLRGTLRLSLCTGLGRRVLLPHLADWSRNQADLVLDVRLEEREVDPLAAGVDIVVRAGKARDSAASRTVLGDYGHVLVAAPSLLEGRPRPRHPAELRAFPALTLRLERVWSTWPFRQNGREVRFAISPKLVVNDAESLLLGALRGDGVTVLPDHFVRDALKAGTLVALLPRWKLSRAPVLAFHAPKVRLSRLTREALQQLRVALER